MKLEPLMNYYANLVVPVEVGKGPFGNRVIIEVDGGEFEGPKLKGTIRKPACDLPPVVVPVLMRELGS